MPEVELSAGVVEYEDTGGDGPVLVLLHGLLMDSTLWRKVVPALPATYRCILPTLPLGGHRRPMRPDADLSLQAMGRLVAELLERIDLQDVTLVLNDWGGGQLAITEGLDERICRLVLCSCEAFDNYPPGLPGKAIAAAARAPGGLYIAMQGLRLRAMRRAPGSWGWMSKRPVPDDVMNAWFAPATTNPEIRRDLRKYGTSVPPKATLLEWSDRLRSFKRPVLVVWAREDKLMPADHATRLVELFPDARLVWVDDSYTLIPEDQPEPLALAIDEFVASTRIG